MDEEEKRKKIAFYINKLQGVLTKVIKESDEFQELKRLANSEDSEIQFCIFSVMSDKDGVGSFKNLDKETVYKMLTEAHKVLENNSEEKEQAWTDDDKEFLKDLKIIL